MGSPGAELGGYINYKQGEGRTDRVQAADRLNWMEIEGNMIPNLSRTGTNALENRQVDNTTKMASRVPRRDNFA